MATQLGSSICEIYPESDRGRRDSSAGSGSSLGAVWAQPGNGEGQQGKCL